MSPPADVLSIGEERQLVLDAFQRQSLEALNSALPYVGESVRPWQAAVSEIAPTLLTAQQAGAATSEGYLTDVLAAQGESGAAEIRVRPQGFTDLSDGGGSWVKNLLFAPPSAYKSAIVDGLGTAIAAARARYVAQVVTLDGLRDTARAADTVGMFGRGVSRYVRVLRGRSCARCAILAGRVYKLEAFRRHLNCDCYHIPLANSNRRPSKWSTNPAAYFDSLSESEQDRIFGEGAALAIRASSSKELAMSQVVNADQGVYTANAFGRDVRATRSGTTVRGTFGGYEVLPDGSFRKRTVEELQTNKSVSRYRFTRELRLMPDQILALSEEFGWSREMTISQLRRFGYVY